MPGASRGGSKRRRALVVEDVADIAGMLEGCLASWGWEVRLASGAAEALRAFRPGRYAALVCDVNLPDENGIALAAKLCLLDGSLRAVMISADPANVERARKVGFARCLAKPFAPPRLKALLGEGVV